MGANTRFFPYQESGNTIFEFWIDTRNVVAGATNGSENPLTFIIPISNPTNISHQFIVRVNDGRADVNYQDILNPNITVATAGIYKVTLIGKTGFMTFGENAVDKKKMIYLDKLGSTFKGITSFYGYSNLIIRAPETVKLTGEKRNFFREIKGFAEPFDMARLDVSEVTGFSGFFSGIQNPLTSVLNPFIKNATILSGLYDGVNLSLITRLEIISPTVTTLIYMLRSTNFRGELIIKAPITSVFGLLNGVLNPPSLGKVDVRFASDFGGGWISGSSGMSTVNVDSTLVGWVNNFDWSATPVISRTVNFYDSKYSNNPAVIAARSFLISKGFTFSRLTMQT